MSLDGFTSSFKNRVSSALCVGVALVTLPSTALANTVVPNFTRGTVTAETISTTKIIETIRQVEYTTGTSYTVTGTNITFTGTPAPGNSYTLTTPGAPFQFSETYLGPGIAKETWIDRTTETESKTNSISVFTQ